MAQFQNPVRSGFYPDPSICRVGDDYYLVNSSFEYFPGVPISHSRDLVHWRTIGHCLTSPGQLDLEGCASSLGIYAPSIRYHQGTFYMITTNVSGKGNFFVTATNPAGPWSDPTWIEVGGIDPSLFFDDDGQVYLTCQGPEGVKQATIDLASGKLTSALTMIWEGSGGAYPEGPHLYRIHGLYYLMLAEGGTEYGHMETMARSTSPWGPFEPCPRNPILSHRSLCTRPIQSLGHADLVQAGNGEWWAVCLGVRHHGYPFCHHLGRETFLVPLTWDPEGWPVMGTKGKIDPVMDAPNLSPAPWPTDPIRDNFDRQEPGLGWQFLRNPRAADWSLTERPGSLCLRGSAIGLSDQDSPAWLGRRQSDFYCEAWTSLDFSPGKDGEEAGISIRMNDHHHYEIARCFRAGQGEIMVRRTIGSLTAITKTARWSGSMVELGIRADKNFYHLLYRDASGQEHELDQAETRYLSTEVAGGFTGVYFAIYATGNGKPCSVPAYFDWFEYRQVEPV